MSTPFSHHHFMFPFRWDILPAGFGISDIKENISFDKRTDLESIPNEFGKWKRKPFSFVDETGKFLHENYNEFTYYHEFVAKAIYDYPFAWKKNQEVQKYYEYEIAKDSIYIINYLAGDKKESIQLEVNGISLHLYNTGIGILSFNLSNCLDSQKSLGHILKINEFGRRIYPQYMNFNGNIACKNNFLADSIELNIGDAPIHEDFSWFDGSNRFLTPEEPYQLPKHITALFPADFIFSINGTLAEPKKLITKIADDRMFFLCWYGNDGKSKEIADHFEAKEEIINNWWYAFVFGDKESPSIANKVMQKEQLKAHSYIRWIGYKTIYGMSRDSLVCLTDSSDFARSLMGIHMQTIYYNMMVLCLAQRASILKFTAEVANLADLAKIEEEKNLIRNIKEVYKNYIEFINKLYFREVTSQIQGIELYTQTQKLMNIEKEINDLDNEIGELHQYVSLMQDSERNEEAAKLNRLAIFFLPFTVVFGILGANFLKENSFSDLWTKGAWQGVLIGSLISIFISVFIFLFNKLNKK
ncbi:MAG: CorA family divalent cation transporter [Chitinophagales bacterium]|nr:CorA family divalent cation transporter [Chitinophagales bacterium]